MEARGTGPRLIGAVGRAATLVLCALVVGRAGWMGLSSLNRQVATLAAQNRVITVGGGDVSLRDSPKAHEFRQGRFFTDPYYAGEQHWYPFLTPLVVAAVSKLGGGPVPESYFRAEVGFVALYLIALGVLAFTLLRWQGLLLLPVVAWLGALPPAHGLYPIEAARGGLCLFLAWAGVVLDSGSPSPRRALALGGFAGLLGLWSGAPFFVAAGLTAIIVARAALREWRQDPLPLRRWLPALAAGALVPLALLFGPELAQHGRLAMPGAARTWLADIYDGGTLGKALTLALAPRGVHLVLVLAALLRLLVGRRLGLPCWRRALPLALAYTGCLLLAHLGFIAADPTHPALGRLARRLMLAPSHTFLAAANAARPILEVVGLAALLELAGRALARLRVGWRPAWTPLVPALAAVAYGVLLFTFPYRITRFESSETRGFQSFAARVGELVGATPVFFRYPGRLVQGTSIKILRLSVPEYANPYSHDERIDEERVLDAALAAGSLRVADGVLDRYRIAFIMEDPRAPADPVIRRCGGEVLIEHEGYRLRRRSPCRM